MNTNRTTLPPLSPELKEAVEAEARAHGFGAAATRWLALLIENDPALPAPTAGAMVARVERLPIGQDLATLDQALLRLDGRDSSEMSTSERRVSAMVLMNLVARANALLGEIT